MRCLAEIATRLASLICASGCSNRLLYASTHSTGSSVILEGAAAVDALDRGSRRTTTRARTQHDRTAIAFGTAEPGRLVTELKCLFLKL